MSDIDMKAGTAYLKVRIEEHSGMQALTAFGKKLAEKPLTPNQCKKLFASLWAFYHETPSGILSIALRMNDFWNQRVSPWDAMEKASFLLSASVDEFGLERMHERYLPTHHQLFIDAAHFFSVTKEDLLSQENILPSGKRIGQLSAQFYREKSLAAGLGYHFASELTSYPEFTCLYHGFSAHKDEYQLTSDCHPGLKFFWVHTLVEPQHLQSSIKMIDAFLDVKARVMNEIIEGAMIYMDAYMHLFSELQGI